MTGKIQVLPDENLGGVLREFREVERKAKVGDKKLLPDGTILTAVEPYVRDEGKTPGMWFQDTRGERYPYYNDDNNRLIEPTDIVHINGARYRLVDRKVKVGEKVIVVNACTNGESYKNGDIFVVCKVRQKGIFANVDSEEYITLFHSEYRVLEPIESGHETNDDPENAIRPPYYHKGGIDVIKFAELHFPREQLIGFHRINILKYVTRYDRKGGVEDLRKAEEYLRRLIEMEEKAVGVEVEDDD